MVLLDGRKAKKFLIFELNFNVWCSDRTFECSIEATYDLIQWLSRFDNAGHQKVCKQYKLEENILKKFQSEM